jgi:hypothetical protein
VKITNKKAEKPAIKEEEKPVPTETVVAPEVNGVVAEKDEDKVAEVKTEENGTAKDDVAKDDAPKDDPAYVCCRFKCGRLC